MSVGSTFGRLFFGKLCDHPRVNRLYCFQIAMLVIGVADTLSTLTESYAGLVVYMVVFGVFDGCFVVLLAVLCADIVGVDKVAAGIGVQFFFMAITSIAGPPLAGKCRQLSCVQVSEYIKDQMLESRRRSGSHDWSSQLSTQRSCEKKALRKEIGSNPVKSFCFLAFNFTVA